jgi:hypothetical protein
VFQQAGFRGILHFNRFSAPNWTVRILEQLEAVQPSTTRIRITRRATDEVDGVSLALFKVGRTYEVSPLVARSLIDLGCARPVSELRTRANEVRYGFNVALRPAVAADSR